MCKVWGAWFWICDQSLGCWGLFRSFFVLTFRFVLEDFGVLSFKLRAGDELRNSRIIVWDFRSRVQGLRSSGGGDLQNATQEWAAVQHLHGYHSLGLGTHADKPKTTMLATKLLKHAKKLMNVIIAIINVLKLELWVVKFEVGLQFWWFDGQGERVH